jgi:hypothetical protein
LLTSLLFANTVGVHATTLVMPGLDLTRSWHPSIYPKAVRGRWIAGSSRQ